MVNGHDFDERVEVDRVAQEAGRGSNSHNGVLGAVGHDFSPPVRVYLVLLDHIVNHLIQMAPELVIEPLVGPSICHSIRSLLLNCKLRLRSRIVDTRRRLEG